jgi:hypothetical protein
VPAQPAEKPPCIVSDVDRLVHLSHVLIDREEGRAQRDSTPVYLHLKAHTANVANPQAARITQHRWQVPDEWRAGPPGGGPHGEDPVGRQEK